MPASFGLKCPHLHCTRVHNKGLKMPTSPCARAQSKTCVRQEDTRAPACTRQETRASYLHASKRCVHYSLLRAFKDTRVHRCVHPQMRVPSLLATQRCAHPCSSRRKDARIWTVTR